MLAAASFVSMDSVIKLMAPRYDALQFSFFRFAGGTVFAVLPWAWKRSALPERTAWRLHGVRSLFLLVSLVGDFHALTQLALAVTISYLAPIFVSVLAIPILKERPSPSIWAALTLGLAGVSISLLPELRGSLDGKSAARLLGMLSAAVAAVAFSFVMLFARKQSRSDSVWTILLIRSALPLVLPAVAAPLAQVRARARRSPLSRSARLRST